MAASDQAHLLALPERTYLYAGTRFNGGSSPPTGMVSVQEIQEEGLTTDEVMDMEFADPQREPKIVPEWEENPDCGPGEEFRLEDDELVWERDGFEVRLWCEQVAFWKATIAIPDSVGHFFPTEFDLKCESFLDRGFVESVEIEHFATVEATIGIKENFQPTWEVNQFIDDLLETKEKGEEDRAEMSEMLAAARENEE